MLTRKLKPLDELLKEMGRDGVTWSVSCGYLTSSRGRIPINKAGELCPTTTKFYNSCKNFFIDETSQGEDLVGFLCGFSDESIETAKRDAENLTRLEVVASYASEAFTTYRAEDGTHWRYAYPVKLGDAKDKLYNPDKEQ